MHASLLLATIALSPLALTAPAPTPPRLSSRGKDSTTPPSCNLATVAQPPNTLTPPTSSMHLALIALGQGTQNYTCTTPSSPPSPIGALAQLYNASCALAANPSLAVLRDPGEDIGLHFFADKTTPEFDIPLLGNTRMQKVEEVDAPAAGNVKWLRLQPQSAGTTSGVKMVYRLSTVGGLAPASCKGKAAGEVVTVGYEAQYWIYA